MDDYFKDIIDFLTTGTAPTEYNTKQKKQLVVKAVYFMMIAGDFTMILYTRIRRNFVEVVMCASAQEDPPEEMKCPWNLR